MIAAGYYYLLSLIVPFISNNLRYVISIAFIFILFILFILVVKLSNCNSQ